MFSPEIWLLIAAIFLLAGSIKGFIGIGFPTVIISIGTQFIDPRIAIALVLAPSILSNLWLTVNTQPIVDTAKKYYRIAIPLIILTFIFSQFSARLDDATLRIVIGMVVILFSVSNFIVRSVQFNGLTHPYIQWGLGAFCGVLGGITSLPGTPMIMYLLLVGTKKNEFVAAITFLLLCGTVPLAIGYYVAQLTSVFLLTVSLLLFVPALIGILLGRIIRKNIKPKSFHSAILIVFFILGLNLIRTSL